MSSCYSSIPSSAISIAQFRIGFRFLLSFRPFSWCMAFPKADTQQSSVLIHFLESFPIC